MFLFCLGQTEALKVIVEISSPHTTLTAQKEVSMVMIYWKNMVIMVQPHRELAYLADKEKGNSEKKRNYGKVVIKMFLLKLFTHLSEAVKILYVE